MGTELLHRSDHGSRRARPVDVRRASAAVRGSLEPVGADLVALQRAAGNRAVTALVQRRQALQRRKEPGEGSSEGGVVYHDEPSGAAGLTREQRLSGAHWKTIAEAWPNSTSVSDLDSGFATDLQAFLDVLTANHIAHVITAGYRPPQRSFLFHWCVKVAKGKVAPADVPAMAGVDIIWDHGTAVASRKAAQEMADAFGLVGVAAHPSNHNGGTAIDMKLDFSGNPGNTLTYTKGSASVTRTIKTSDEATVGVSSKGKSISGIESRELSKAGADFGVKRALDNDIVHWSRSGR